MMSTLTEIEKRYFEELFGMRSGYVLDFTDRTFSEFFRSTVQLNIDDPKYGATSKAKRLRSFWEQEPDAVVGKILGELLKVWVRGQTDKATTLRNDAYHEATKTVARLTQVAASTISEVTRRAIFDFFKLSGTNWAGRLAEDEFLARLYDLTAMPSDDPRMQTAAADIRQHRVVNCDDWPNDWIFYDPRFNLLHGPDDQLLRFLCETVHPVVRPDTEEARGLVEGYNLDLAADGWSIVEVKQVSGKPVFAQQKIGARVQVFAEPTGWQKVDRQLQEVRLRLDTANSEEQYQAVGLLCREVLISVAQEVYDASSHPSLDGVAPSDTDAKRMLEAIFNAELPGAANEEVRAHARAALRLALALQHKRTADFRMAALCAEATSSIVNMLAVLAGRR